MCLSAVADACRQLNERLEPFRKPGLTFAQVASAAYFERVDLSAHGFYKTPDVTGFGGMFPFNYFTFGAACSEVELDTLTGDWHLLRSDLCMDVGQSLNPAIDIGQVPSMRHLCFDWNASQLHWNGCSMTSSWENRGQCSGKALHFIQVMMMGASKRWMLSNPIRTLEVMVSGMLKIMTEQLLSRPWLYSETGIAVTCRSLIDSVCIRGI